MSFTITPATSPEQLTVCQELLATVFHQELKLFGMAIPDRYDPFSVYMQLLYQQDCVGTYRVVLPNPTVGFPIEEVAFEINQFAPERVCEMSRLAILESARGKMPFNKIIASACGVAAQHNAGVMVAAILPRNVPLFKRQGFTQVGTALSDPTVQSDGLEGAESSVIIPMQKQIVTA